MSQTETNQRTAPGNSQAKPGWMPTLGQVAAKAPKEAWWLLGIVALAFIGRLMLVHYGLPLLLYEDEPIYYDHAMRFGLGYWNIGYFKKPTFFLYTYAASYYLAYLYSHFMSWKDYLDAFWKDPTYVASVGRSLSVAFAAGTVYLTGKIGQRAFSWWVGLTAAFFLAVDSTHVAISPIVISDIPALFFILGAAWFGLRVSESGRWKDYLLCAASVALAASFKYNVFSVMFLLVGHLAFQIQARNNQPQTGWGAFIKSVVFSPRLWTSLGLIPALFLLLNPLVLLDFKTFWHDLNVEKRHMLMRDSTNPAAVWHPMAAFNNIFAKIMPRSLGWLLYIPGFAGIALGLWKARRPALVLLSFPLLFLAVVSQFHLINAKYLLPVIPFWYIMAALALRDAFAGLRAITFPRLSAQRAAMLAGLLVIGLSFWTWTASLSHIHIFTKADTRNFAYDQLISMVRPGDRILLEPDTLTMDNAVYRTWMVIADCKGRNSQGPKFELELHSPSDMRRVSLSSMQPKYVLLNLGAAEKLRASNGKTYYQMPYKTSYYRDLRNQYHLKSVFAPFSVRLTKRQMQTLMQREGFSSFYEELQHQKSDRKRPGPSMLLFERQDAPAETNGTPSLESGQG